MKSHNLPTIMTNMLQTYIHQRDQLHKNIIRYRRDNQEILHVETVQRKLQQMYSDLFHYHQLILRFTNSKL